MHCLSKAQACEFVRQRRALFDAAGRVNPFAGSEWNLLFIEHIVPEGWQVIIPEHLGDGESLMLLYGDGRIRHRRQGLANCYTSLYSPLVSSARDRKAALGRLVADLAGSQRHCAILRFSPLDPEAPDTQALGRVLAERGWYVRRYACQGNWHLPCAGLAFDEYMANRDSRLRNTWLRKARKFQTGGERGTRLEIVTGGDGLEGALDAYEHVYGRSWKEPELSPAFIRDWARVCARNGWLRLGLAWVDGMPVAAQFWFTLHGRANIFKLAYDEAYAKWSAGTVLTAHMFRHSLDEDRVADIDYLTGDDAYKRSWMSVRRERIGFLACNLRTVRGLALGAYEAIGQVCQRWRLVDRLRSRPGVLSYHTAGNNQSSDRR